MISDEQIWRSWIATIQHWGIAEWVATFLEMTAPFTIIATQLVYIGQPLLGATLQNGKLNALTHLLEDNNNMQSFVNELRQESRS